MTMEVKYCEKCSCMLVDADPGATICENCDTPIFRNYKETDKLEVG